MTINRVAELEEEVQDLTAKIEQLKVKNVELELDNEYLKNEIERILYWTSDRVNLD
jgi:regulator of replication initiation timing